MHEHNLLGVEQLLCNQQGPAGHLAPHHRDTDIDCTLHTIMRSQHSHAVVCNEICSLDTAMGAMGAGGIIEHVTKQT